MRLTSNFTMWEFTKTSHQDLQQKNIDEATQYLHYILDLSNKLQKLRDFIFRKIYVCSGFRCKELNDRVKGSANSQHMKGQAVDFTVQDFADPKGLKFIFDWCEHNLEYGQLIFENPPGRKPWIHLGLPREGRNPTAYYFDGKKYVLVKEKKA
jgi:zinc D-Ala-D-Ala carboxypeptidase